MSCQGCILHFSPAHLVSGVYAPLCGLQVEVAKKIMFEQQQKDDGIPRKNSRRETWCPGRSAWAPPLAGTQMWSKEACSTQDLHVLYTAVCSTTNQ